MRRRRACGFLLLVTVLAVSCSTAPTPRRISIDALPSNVPTFAEPRDVTVHVLPVMDSRPKIERKGGTRVRLKYFIYFVLYAQWASVGPKYESNLHALPDFQSELELLTSNVLSKSNVCRVGEGDGQIDVEMEVLHCYGVSFVETWHLWLLGQSLHAYYRFFPTGCVICRVTLRDSASGEVIGDRLLDSSFLFSTPRPAPPKEGEAQIVKQDVSMSVRQWRENSLQVTLSALRRMAEQMPYLVDEVLADWESDHSTSSSDVREFTVYRLTREYDFQEEVVIEYETGEAVEGSGRKTCYARYFPA